MSERMGEREWRDEIPDYRLLSERRPVAAKDTICDHCKGPILKGQRYYRCAQLVDGKFETVRSHGRYLECTEPRP